MSEQESAPAGVDSETQITLGNVYRGTHALQVQIVNETGEPVAESEEVTFYMQRTTRLLPAPVAVPLVPVEPPPPMLPELPPEVPVEIPDDAMAVQDPGDRRNVSFLERQLHLELVDRLEGVQIVVQ